MERIINYRVELNEIHPKSPQFAGVQGEHNATAIKISFSDEFNTELQKQYHFYDNIKFRIDYTDSLGKVIYGEVKDISEVAEPFYLTRSMTKIGDNTSAVLKISCFNNEGTEKEFYTGVMRFYFESCESVVLAETQEGSILSPIVNQARIYRNEAYDCAETAIEAENTIKNMTEENKTLKEQTEAAAQVAINTSQKALEIEGKIDNANETLEGCIEATALAESAANGVVTIEQNRQIPLKISVMTKEEYEASVRPDPEGYATLDIIENEQWVDYIYPVGSIYMSVNSTEPNNLFGGIWERIKDRFLLAAGDNFSPGQTGGEAEHILSESEMPSHSHRLLMADQAGVTSVAAINWVWDEKGQMTRTTERIEETGGNQPHNNMPPYLAVYMWQRIA